MTEKSMLIFSICGYSSLAVLLKSAADSMRLSISPAPFKFLSIADKMEDVFHTNIPAFQKNSPLFKYSVALSRFGFSKKRETL